MGLSATERFQKKTFTMCMKKKEAEHLYDTGKEATVAKLLILDTKVDELNERIAKLTKNSSNSSKPPSSDIVKPKPPVKGRGRKKKRRAGGQPGHARYERIPFSPDEVTPVEYTLTSCPDCHGAVTLLNDRSPRIVQQIALPEKPIEKLEHRGYAYWCPQCEKIHYASIPRKIRNAGLLDEHYSATICFLKYVGCVPLSGIKKYFNNVLDVPISKGQISKILKKGSCSLERCYEELLNALPYQNVVNADETGHKQNGKKQWTWVFRSSLYALFKISPSRGSDVLIDVLGKEFNGVLGCDYFSAYHKYMKDFDISIQFCLAHLIRDVKYMVDYHDKVVSRYGKKLLDAIRDLFHTIHLREKMTTEKFTAQLEANKKAVIKAATSYVPERNLVENMAKRFREHGKEYFTFITSPRIDPTNNCAEQAIRFVVIYRKVSQGTRSDVGRIACERFFTVVATCTMQGISVFKFLCDTFKNYFAELPTPSLLPVVNTS